MAYIGQEPLVEFSSVPTKDSFTGDGSTVAFDMAAAVVSAADNALEVFIDNVRQEPGSGKSYTVGLDGSNENKRITFSAAPANGAAIYVINDKSNTTTLVAPTNLGGVELILDADNDTSITADTDDQIDFKIGSADHLKILSSSGDTVFKPMVDAKDIIFQQFDGNKIFCIDDGNFVSVGGNSAAPGEIRIYEDTDLGANYTGFKAGNLTASVAYQLPLADGSSGQALATDGSGVLSWTTIATNTPTSADGQALGSASLEWSDLFLADGAVINLGADQDVTLTHVADTGVLLNGASVIQFRDSGLTIGSNADGDLDIVSDGTAVDSINIESAGGITLDAGTAGSGVIYEDDGTEMMRIHNSSSDVIIETKVSDKDFIIKGNDGGSVITPFTLDMSAGGDLFLTGGLIDLKNDGSAVSQIKFYCESSNAHAQTLIGAPHAQGATNTLTLPDGNDGVLVSTVSTATLTNKTLTSPVINTGTFGTSILPTSADGTTLGSASKEFSDLFLADSSTIQFGNDQDTTLTHTDGAGLTLNSTNKLMFNDASQFIQGASATVLDIAATDEIELTATLIDVVGNLAVSGTTTQTGVLTANAGVVVDNITIDGTEIDLSSGDLTVDVAGDIILDADGGDVFVKDAGTTYGSLTNTSGNLIIKSGTTTAATFSGANVTFAGTIGSGAITSTGIVTGTGFTAGSAVLAEAELELLDGLTAGTAIASKVVTTDANIDSTGMRNLTISGELDAATLDISGNADIDGTTNLDVVDIDGALTQDGGAVFNEDSADVDFRIESNGNANMLFVDGGGDRVYIGRNTSDGVANVKLQVESLDSSSGISVHRASADTGGPALYLSSSRGASLGDDTVVQDGDDLGSIAWFGADGTDRNSPAASISGQVDGTPGSNDMPGRIVFKTTTDGGVTQTERMRIHSSGNIGIGTTNALGKVHIRTGDSSASAHATGDELVIEGSGNAGLSILSGNTSEGVVYFGDTNDNNVGRFVYDHNLNHIAFHTSGSEQMRLNSSGILSLNEAAPDAGIHGITLNQGAADGNILTAKSSDVAHGVTGLAETDTFLDMLKNSDGGGGLLMRTFSETATSFRHVVVASGSSTAESSAATSYWSVDARKNADNTNVTGLAADDNLASFRHSDEAKFIIKGDGELFSDQSATVGTFDAYQDAQLVRAFDLNHMQGVINSKFDKFVQYNKDDLQKARLIGTDDDGNATPMVNITGMSRLHNGAIWQQYEATQRLTQAMYKLAIKTLGKEEADKLLDEEEIKLLN